MLVPPTEDLRRGERKDVRRGEMRRHLFREMRLSFELSSEATSVPDDSGTAGSQPVTAGSQSDRIVMPRNFSISVEQKTRML